MDQSKFITHDNRMIITRNQKTKTHMRGEKKEIPGKRLHQ
jgi:hypothetical protein